MTAFESFGIPRFALNTHGRDFAVGDIHGAFDALQRAMEAIGFDARKDRLFSVGDLVDRGPESHQVLAWLGQPWFHAISGNHDFMAWRSALGDPFLEVDHLAHGGQWLEALSSEELQCLGEQLSRLPIALEVETTAGLVGLVHADCPFDDWQHMHGIDRSRLAQRGSPAGQCLWSTDRYDYRYCGTVKNIAAVVHGHVTLPSMVTLGNAYFIDTGGWRQSGSYFTFLDLQTRLHVTGPANEIRRGPSRRNR